MRAHRVVEALGRCGRRRGFPDPGVQGRQLKARTVRQDHGSMDGVSKLADVSGPRVADESVHHVGRDRFDAAADTSSMLSDEVMYKPRDVLRSLAQGRKVDREYVQPV